MSASFARGVTVRWTGGGEGTYSLREPVGEGSALSCALLGTFLATRGGT